MIWVAVGLTALGCYALKALGATARLPQLDRPRVRAVVEAVPVALLGALVALQTVTTGHRLVLDARAAGLAAALACLLARAPFLLVVVVAAAVTALVRAA